jgi:hypothetical protein
VHGGKENHGKLKAEIEAYNESSQALRGAGYTKPGQWALKKKIETKIKSFFFL